MAEALNWEGKWKRNFKLQINKEQTTQIATELDFLLTRNKNFSHGTRNVKLKSQINQEQKTKWPNNRGTQNPIQGLMVQVAAYCLAYLRLRYLVLELMIVIE